MTNNAASKFVQRLISVFCNYAISADKKGIYLEKLSKWRLAEDEWNKVLDELIETRPEKESGSGLPELSEIYPIIKRIQLQEKPKNTSAYAWASFRLNDCDYAIRCRNDQGIWVIADLVYTDAHGTKHHKQQHVGEPVALHIPEGATNFRVSPDAEADPEPEDMPTTAEVRELVGKMSM